MHATTLPPPDRPLGTRRSATGLVRELYERERRLALYGALLALLIVPMLVAAGVDDRLLRGANIWIKPIKFAASIALFAWTTAWFIGHLEPARRRGRAVDAIVWIVIGAGTFELAYIALQAALGQASHYNVGDAFHGLMYTLMGLGALLLTTSQPLLAWQLWRHADRSRPAAYRHAVLIGLVLTFAFGAGVGLLLGGLKPPAYVPGESIPLVGWSLNGADLRPAHFVGIHAAQAIPLAGWWLARRVANPRHARAWVWAATAAWSALFAAAVAYGLSGDLQPVQPPVL